MVEPKMKVLKFYGLLAAFFVISNCFAQLKTETKTETTGRIAFAVLSELATENLYFTEIGIEVFFKNQETGKIHNRLISFDNEASNRVEYFDNLAPGRYVIERFNDYTMGGLIHNALKPVVEFEIKPGQTTLAPLFIHLYAQAYSWGALDTIDNKSFWGDYIVDE